MKWYLKLLLLLVVCAVGLWIWRSQGRAVALVAPAESGTAVNAVIGTAEVFAVADLRVKTERYGLVEEFSVKADQMLKKGDQIALQSATELEVQLEQVKIRLEAARAREELPSLVTFDIENLKDQIESTRLAVRLQQASTSRLEQEMRELEKREAQLGYELISERESVLLLEQEMRRLEYQVGQMNITAPFSGKVVEIFAFEGDLLGAGANLVRLVAPGRFIEVTLSEEDAAGVAAEQAVDLRLASIPGRLLPAKVSRPAPFANRDDKTRKIFVDVEEDIASLLDPGLTGEAIVYKAERKNAVLIPRRALVGDQVWVVKDGVVERRRVQVGFVGIHQVEVTEGLSEGDLVVLENQNQFADGARVQVSLAR